MRKKRDPESDDQRRARLEKIAGHRRTQVSAEEAALDDAVRQSIELHGA